MVYKPFLGYPDRVEGVQVIQPSRSVVNFAFQLTSRLYILYLVCNCTALGLFGMATLTFFLRIPIEHLFGDLIGIPT